nr:hypothetical protein JG3_0030 [uncultured bacterium]
MTGEAVLREEKSSTFRTVIAASMVLNIIVGFIFWTGMCGFFFFYPAVLIMVLFNLALYLSTVKAQTVSHNVAQLLWVFVLSQTLYGISGFLGWAGDTPPGPHTEWRGEDGYFGLNLYLHTNIPTKVFEIAQTLAITLFVCSFTVLLVSLVKARPQKLGSLD